MCQKKGFEWNWFFEIVSTGILRQILTELQERRIKKKKLFYLCRALKENIDWVNLEDEREIIHWINME